jgi:predicted nucleic acid-binding Zn ribbon protein
VDGSRHAWQPRDVSKRARPARRVGGVLDTVLDNLGVASAVEQHAVFREWESRVGREIARAAQPHRVDGETLLVNVTNSAWMSELSLRQNELLERLNRGRRRTCVKRLIFRMDPRAKE